MNIRRIAALLLGVIVIVFSNTIATPENYQISRPALAACRRSNVKMESLLLASVAQCRPAVSIIGGKGNNRVMSLRARNTSLAEFRSKSLGVIVRDRQPMRG